jgi:DDE superfamily endonuclease
VFSVDEKTAIQALDRLDPVLPLSPGRAERHGFEYYRHGTLSLYAAFNTKSGEVLGKTAERHTSAEFVAFLTDLVVNQPKGQEIHVIADTLKRTAIACVRSRYLGELLIDHFRRSAPFGEERVEFALEPHDLGAELASLGLVGFH